MFCELFLTFKTFQDVLKFFFKLTFLITMKDSLKNAFEVLSFPFRLIIVNSPTSPQKASIQHRPAKRQLGNFFIKIIKQDFWLED